MGAYELTQLCSSIVSQYNWIVLDMKRVWESLRPLWLIVKYPYRGSFPINSVTGASHSRVSISSVVGCSPVTLTST